MDKILAAIIDSIGRYFVTYYRILKNEPARQRFLFRNDDTGKDKNDSFEYTFFFYSVLMIYLLYYFMGKFVSSHSKQHKLIALVTGAAEFQNEKYLIVACGIVLLLINLFAFMVTSNMDQKDTIKKFTIYIFGFQLSVWYFSGFVGGFLSYFGLLEDERGAFKTILLVIITLAFLAYVIRTLFLIPFRVINGAARNDVISEDISDLLRFFVFLPLVITIALRFLMPFREVKQTYHLEFPENNNRRQAMFVINSQSDSSYRMSLRFMFKNNSDESLFIEARDAFHLHYRLFEDKDGNRKGDAEEIVYDDTIMLHETKGSADIVMLKPNDARFWDLEAMLSRKKYTELIEVIKRTRAHIAPLQMKTIDDSIRTIYNKTPKVVVDGRTLQFVKE